jgi:hypothetical protein
MKALFLAIIYNIFILYAYSYFTAFFNV